MITLNKNGLFNRFISVYGLRGDDCYKDTLCSLFMRSILGVLVVLHIIILPTLIVLANMHMYYFVMHNITGGIVFLNDLSLFAQCLYVLYVSIILLVELVTVVGGLTVAAAFTVVYVLVTIVMTTDNLVDFNKITEYLRFKQLKDKLCIKVNWKDK